MASTAHGLTKIGTMWIRFDEVNVINTSLEDCEENIGYASEIELKNGESWLIDDNDTAVLKQYLSEQASTEARNQY